MTRVYITHCDGEYDVEVEAPCDLPEELVTVDDDVLKAWRNHCAQHRLWNTYWSAAKDLRQKPGSGPVSAHDAWREYTRTFGDIVNLFHESESAPLRALLDKKTP